MRLRRHGVALLACAAVVLAGCSRGGEEVPDDASVTSSPTQEEAAPVPTPPSDASPTPTGVPAPEEDHGHEHGHEEEEWTHNYAPEHDHDVDPEDILVSDYTPPPLRDLETPTTQPRSGPSVGPLTGWESPPTDRSEPAARAATFIRWIKGYGPNVDQAGWIASSDIIEETYRQQLLTAYQVGEGSTPPEGTTTPVDLEVIPREIDEETGQTSVIVRWNVEYSEPGSPKTKFDGMAMEVLLRQIEGDWKVYGETFPRQ